MIRKLSVFLGVAALTATSAASAGWQEYVSKFQDMVAPPGGSGKVLLCFASEKKAMGDYLTAEVKKVYPGITVEMHFAGSGELLQELKDGNKRGCSLVSPASRLLAVGAPGYTPSAKSIGATPIVLVMKADAANEIDKVLGRSMEYKDIPTVGMQPWKKYATGAVGMRGIIKIGITQATHSNSGAVAGVTFAHTKLEKYDPLVAEDVDEIATDMQDFWKKTSHVHTSTGDLGNEFASDAGTLTGIVTYESELPKIVAGMATRGGVRVVYPDPGIMNDHPAWVTENAPNANAAESVLAYLLSVDGQNMMARKTFMRPVNPKARLEFPAEVASHVLWDVGPVDIPADRKVIVTMLEYLR